MDADAIRGRLDSLILAVLDGEPRHGYAVIEAVRQRSRGTFSLTTGSVYPALRRLEQAGFVRGTWNVVDGRRRRTYEITGDGQQELAGQRVEWGLFRRAVDGLLRGATGAGAACGPEGGPARTAGLTTSPNSAAC